MEFDNKSVCDKKYEAVIFDLDGTLIDSMGVWLKIDEEFLGKRGFESSKDYAEQINARSFRDAAKYTIERFSLDDSVEDLMNEWNEMALYEYSHNIKLKNGAKEYIQALKNKNIKIGLATSCSNFLFEPLLKNNDIYDYFDVLCSTEEVACGKEGPDIFLYTADKMNIKPENCLVFEDILIAMKSAKKAGMDVFGVYDHFSKEQWEEIKKIADGTIFEYSDAPLMK